MKRLFIIAFSIVAFSACTNRYNYTLTEFDPLLNERRQIEETIHAKNDSLAFEQALIYFSRSRQIYNDIHKERPALVFPFPENFELRDKNGNKVYFADRFAKCIPSIPVDHKAYAGIDFGMSMSEVKANSRFAVNSWSQSDNRLYTSDKIGNIKYSVIFNFVNDKLYRVQFSEFAFAWDDYEVVIQYVENLNYVFTEAYGQSPFDSGIPQKSEMYYGETKTVSKWFFPAKNASIYMKKHSEENLYSMWGEIIDLNLSEENAQEAIRVKNEKADEKRQSAIKDADLF